MSAVVGGKPSVRLFGDRSGFGSFCVLSLSHCLGLEVDFAGTAASPPLAPTPEQRPCLCLPDAAVGGVRAICGYLLSLNPKHAASVFPLLFAPSRGGAACPAAEAEASSGGPQEAQGGGPPRGYWREQQWLDWILFTLQPALAGIDRPKILQCLETLENTFGKP